MRLDYVDDPLEGSLDEELETVAVHERVPRRAVVGERALDAVARAAQPDGRVGVQAAGGLVRPLQDLARPLG